MIKVMIKWFMYGRKAKTKLDSVLKSRDITLLTKVHIVKPMVFSSSHKQMWELDHKEGWVLKTDAFELWCWRILLKILWTARGWNQSFLKKSTLIFHWKDWCWNCNSRTLDTWWEELTHWKRPWYWERLRAGGEGVDGVWNGWMASLTQWTSV